MKRLLVLGALIAMYISSVIAADSSGDVRRVVMAAAREFDEVYVSGDATVEICCNTRHAGLIVYNNASDESERIRCYNDGTKLYIDGRCEQHGVESRIVVFYDEPLKRIVNNGAGTILATRMPEESSIEVILNGSGAIKLGKKMKLEKVTLINNGEGSIRIPMIKSSEVRIIANGTGDEPMGILKIRCDKLSAITNSSADISIGDVKARDASFVANAEGSIAVAGKVHEATMASNGAGSIEAGKMNCNIVNASSTSTGNIDCRVKKSISAKVYGDGKISYRGNPDSVDANGTNVIAK